MKKSKKTYTIFETFVGAGGSHIGFKQCGFNSIYVNDINKDCLKTLIHNNTELQESALIDNRSIIDINSNDLIERINIQKGSLDVMFGGIVCKGFSLAGQRSPNDERNYFYHKQLELVKVFKPKISIIENVKAFLNGKVLSEETPIEIKNLIDATWKKLENFKGQKAELRKKNKITKEFEDYGQEIKKDRAKLIDIINNNNYLISVVDDIIMQYEKIGYKVKINVLNSAWYGASTKRERVIIVAIRNDINIDYNFPSPLYSSSEINTKIPKELINSEISYKKPITIAEALSKIDYSKKDIDNLPMNHSIKTKERFKYIKEGGNITDVMEELPEELKISSFYSRGNTMRLHMDKLAPTLVPGHSNFPVHPKEHRSITVREAAVITGFPLEYKFFGNHTKRCEHVGNAVPPPLAKAIASECKILLDKYYSVLENDSISKLESIKEILVDECISIQHYSPKIG